MAGNCTKGWIKAAQTTGAIFDAAKGISTFRALKPILSNCPLERLYGYLHLKIWVNTVKSREVSFQCLLGEENIKGNGLFHCLGIFPSETVGNQAAQGGL